MGRKRLNIRHRSGKNDDLWRERNTIARKENVEKRKRGRRETIP